jgi:hypothetical protein
VELESPPASPAAAPARTAEAAAPASGSGRRLLRPSKLLVESALIVLSVLLGFAANAWHERSVQRDLAAQALLNFRHEIGRNLVTLDSIQPRHAAMAKRLEVAAAAAPNRPGETAFDALLRAMPQGGVSLPPLPDAAWETAVSTGALRLLDYQRAATLSQTYQVQRAMLGQTIQRLEDRLNTPEMFEPASRQSMLRVHQLIFLELSGQEIYLVEVYRRTLRELGGTPAAAATARQR